MTSIPDSLKQHFSNKQAQILGSEAFSRFAVFVPLIERDNELQIIFQIRSHLVRQPGEICFPGGKVDKDDLNTKTAALRELREEMGIPEKDVTVLGELDYVVTPFRLMVFPYIGALPSESSFNINKDEVEDIFYAPVSELMKMEPKEHRIKLEVEPDQDFPFHLIPNGENYNWRTGIINEQFYEFNGHVIWGLTARILTHALKEMQQGGFRP